MTLITGRLSEEPLARVLSRILACARSGALKISKGAMIRQLFIERGKAIRYAASNLLPESLSEHLKRQGRFRPEQMRKATASKEPRELLSSSLLRLGFISPEEHRALVGEMIERIVVGAAAWSDASYEYQEGDLPFTQPGDAGLPVPVAILGLVRHCQDLSALRSVLDGPDRKVRLNPVPAMPIQEIPLDPAEGYLVSRADGTLSLGEIASMSPLGQQETEKALCGLILAGILAPDEAAARPEPPRPEAETVTALPAQQELRSRPSAPTPPAPPPRKPAGPVEEMLERYAALRGQTFYKVLGVATTAPESEIRHAYYSLAKRLHPDKFSDEETKSRAEKVFAAITEAYAALSKPESRREYDQAAAAPAVDKAAAEAGSAAAGAELARQNFLRGKAHFENGEFVKSLPFFEHAVEQDGSKEEYRRFLALVQSRNPRLRREAEQNFLRAIELNPTFAENYAHLGVLYRKMGQEAKGEDYLHKALSWDSTNATAREALGSEDAKKGIFKGLFGK